MNFEDQMKLLSKVAKHSFELEDRFGIPPHYVPLIHQLLYTYYQNFAIVGTNITEATERLAEVKQLIQTIPKGLKPTVKADNKRSYELDNYNRVLAFNCDMCSFRGYSVNMIAYTNNIHNDPKLIQELSEIANLYGSYQKFTLVNIK